MNKIRKGKAENTIYDLIPFEEYKSDGNSIKDNIAVEHQGMIYPIRSESDTRPGLYRNDFSYFLVDPPEYEKDLYVANEDTIISFDGDSVKDLLEKSEKLKNMEREMLTTIDDLTVPNISSKDRPEMVALKRAIIDKNIDIKKYASRFGGTYQNDIRLLKKDSISMGKFVDFLDALDLDATLTIDNREGNEPNPIPEPINVKLTNSRGEEE